jgi:prolyl oligopeptidase
LPREEGSASGATPKAYTTGRNETSNPHAPPALAEDRPVNSLGGNVTEDGRFLVILLKKGADNNNRLYFSDLGDPVRPTIGAPVKPLIDDDDAEFSVFGKRRPVLYLRTDRGAPNRKVIALDVAHPAPSNWRTIVPEAKQAIESVALIGGRIVAQYLVDVQSRLRLFSLDGVKQGDIPLPDTGTVAAISGREDEPEIYYASARHCLPTQFTSLILDPGSAHLSRRPRLRWM